MLNLLICITLSLSSFTAALAPHLWSLFPVCLHHHPHEWLIGLFDMPHLVSGINSLLLSDSLVSVSPSQTLIFLGYHFSFFHKFTTLIIHNSFTLSLPAQNLPLSQILPTIGPHSFSGTDTTDSGCVKRIASRYQGLGKFPRFYHFMHQKRTGI